MLIRIVWIAFIQCIILWIFGQPDHGGFWSALYNGCTVLGRIVMALFQTPIVWFPHSPGVIYIIGFLLGLVITIGAVSANHDD